MISPFHRAVEFAMICPHCGRLNDAATPIHSPRDVPGPDSAMICIECSGISIITADGTPREATPQEAAEVTVQMINTLMPKVI